MTNQKSHYEQLMDAVTLPGGRLPKTPLDHALLQTSKFAELGKPERKPSPPISAEFAALYSKWLRGEPMPDAHQENLKSKLEWVAALTAHRETALSRARTLLFMHDTLLASSDPEHAEGAALVRRHVREKWGVTLENKVLRDKAPGWCKREELACKMASTV